MTTSPADHNQQLLAYLAVWQQLLEQTMTLMGGLPGMAGLPGMGTPGALPGVPAGIPFPPPMVPGTAMPTMPATPNDYAQQLFGYLQSWRQYLEAATGAAPMPPGPVQPPPAQPAAAQASTPLLVGGAHPTPVSGSDEQEVPPPKGQFLARSEGSQSATRFPPDLQDLAPVREGVSQVPGSLFRLASRRAPSAGVGGSGQERAAQQFASRRPSGATPEARTEGPSARSSLRARHEDIAPPRGEGVSVERRPLDFRGIK